MICPANISLRVRVILMKRTVLAIVLGSILGIPAAAQDSARVLITTPIDESRRTVLYGNVSPVAQAASDQGRVDDSLPASRVLLMLNRPPEREAALQQYLVDVHSKGSPAYHDWLTPQAFGGQFGPADSDIQTVTTWLGSKGFQITKISQGKQFIEFSGTMGQLRASFQADIHRYSVNGEIHLANSREISIPTALAAVVRGLAPLNDFRSDTYVVSRGTGHVSRSTHTVTPDWTIANPFGTPNPSAFLVAPEDLATQYDLTPLYQAGTSGTGQTIGIIDASNIDLSLVADFQQMFGLAPNPPEVIIDGDDPGDVGNDDDLEAYLDVEIAGAIAPKSTINLYISDGGAVADPFSFAAIRAVEDDAASVLSGSFGQCESILAESGNQFWASLWEQAAAQGQTVMIATGDSGPTCDVIYPNSVSGIASTPWNVAVGGTDFYYSDYATGGASAPTFWNATNDANLGSLKAPLPEQGWDDGFGLNIISNGLQRGEFGAGGGGPSNCATTTTTTGACIAGYPKPSWQSGTGISDGVRDIPDVSFYASNGANLSSYAICAYEGQCTTELATDADITFVGGTSASAPAMAGIMALVDQKFGRQGQADFTLYALAQQKPAAFHDITLGGNWYPCNLQSANCAQNPDGGGETTVYSAGPGYDMATGLGSVDGNVLVTNWDSISYKSTTTSLKLSPVTITHGTPVTVTTSVSATGGTPTGDVAVLTNSPEPASQSQTFVTLSDGSGSSSVNFFPGGTYQVTAQYGGDGTFAASTSSPVTLTVSPEKSVISIEVVNNNTGYGASGFSFPYDSPLSMNIFPTSVAASTGSHTDGIATGTATFTVDSTSTTVPLDGTGLADFVPPSLGAGSHTVSASYSGDSSFEPSTATPISFTVTKGSPNLGGSVEAPMPTMAPIYFVTPGSSLAVNALVGGSSPPNGAAAPTGTVTFCLGAIPSINSACVNPVYTQTAPLSAPTGLYAQIATATATFPNVGAGPTGYYVLSFTYSGDADWQSASAVDIDEINMQAPAAPSATTNVLSITPSTISGSQITQIVTTITGAGNSGIAPSGAVLYYDNGIQMEGILLAPTGPQTSSAMFLLGTGSFFTDGANQITAIYQGDKNYLPSTSNAVNMTVTQVGNFTMTPSASEITIQPGNSAGIAIGLASAGNFNGNVSMTCVTSSPNITCSVPATTALNGSATPMLMISASSQADLSPNDRVTPPSPPAFAGELGILAIFASLLFAALAIRGRRALLPAGLFAAIVLIAGCGGGNSSSQPPPPPPPAAATYTVIVNATASGMLHTATIKVFVP